MGSVNTTNQLPGNNDSNFASQISPHYSQNMSQEQPSIVKEITSLDKASKESRQLAGL